MGVHVQLLSPPGIFKLISSRLPRGKQVVREKLHEVEVGVSWECVWGVSVTAKEVTDLMVISGGLFYVVPTSYLVCCR